MERETVNKIVANIYYEYNNCTNIKKESITIKIVDKFGNNYLYPVMNVIIEGYKGGVKGAIGFRSDELVGSTEYHNEYHGKITYISCEDIFSITEECNYIDDRYETT